MKWRRIEAGALDPNLTEGIAAAIADPLWLLARQWQVGEFRGEDAASPVLVQATVATVPITECWFERGGRRQTISRQDAPWPLETLVEHEPIATGPAAARGRLESGAELVRRLTVARASADVLAAFRDTYRFTHALDAELDPVGHAQLQLLARRALDAGAVRADLDGLAAAGQGAAQLAPLSGVDEPTATRLAAVVTDWAERDATILCAASGGDGPDAPTAWVTSKLEYRFGLSAAVGGGTIELDADEYPGGQLDWYHFDVRAAPDAAGGAPVPGARSKALSSLATPLQFAGQPAARWWELEDGDVDFGDIAAGPDDLARSVVAAYALVAGDDWFVVPCTLPAGTVARVTSMHVLDDFGQRTPVAATAVGDARAGRRPWRFFELSGDPHPDRGVAPLLFLPPVVAGAAEGPPLEAVEFRRDEMANLAWAIERRVESEAGRPIDREAGAGAGGLPPAGPTDDGSWRYRVATDVPDHWVPLVPIRSGSGGTGRSVQVVLRRGRVALERDASPARGRILEPERPFVINEEEIPAGGLRVTRRYQVTRGADGKVRAWVGRRKEPSGGPLRRTPLRFDVLSGWPRSP